MDEQAKLSWFRARLLPFSSGLLSESDETRFRDLLDNDPRCKQAYEAFTEEADGPDYRGEHIPSALIARWETARTTLTGLERKMVGQHLEGCADCRRDLEMLGHAPTLDEADVVPFPVERTKPKRGWNAGLAVWATLATAACLVLLVLPRTPTPVEIPGKTGFMVLARQPHVRIESKQRGGTTEEQPYPAQLDAGEPLVIRPRLLPIALETPDAILTVTLIDPAGAVVIEGTLPASDLDSGTFVFYPDPQWTEGVYGVELRSPDDELLDEYRVVLGVIGEN